MMKGTTLMLLSSIITTVPLREFLAVLRESLKLLARALWIGIIELKVGMRSPTEMARKVAEAPGTIDT